MVGEILRRIRDLPRQSLARLVSVGQLRDVLQEPAGILDGARFSIRVHDRVVPGRHGLAIGVLARIPRRGDVRLRSLKDDQRLDLAAELLPERIRPRDMRAQRSVRTLIGAHEERDVICGKLAPGEDHERAERMCPHELMQYLEPGFFELLGRIHREASAPDDERCPPAQRPVRVDVGENEHDVGDREAHLETPDVLKLGQRSVLGGGAVRRHAIDAIDADRANLAPCRAEPEERHRHIHRHSKEAHRRRLLVQRA